MSVAIELVLVGLALAGVCVSVLVGRVQARRARIEAVRQRLIGGGW